MPMTTDFDSLLNQRVITQETLEWLKPLYEQEAADLEEIRLAAEERKSNPFYQQDSDEDEDDFLSTETSTLQGIEGTSFAITFVADTQSSGHGNKVWHASIATCRYLKDYFVPKLNSSSFRCLELGAGTAVPSFFLAKLLSQQQQTQSSIVRITDAKYYRNVMQILRSVEIQEDKNKTAQQENSVRIEVHPHNWGDSISFGIEGDGGSSSPQHDLVIVSDCLYDPEYHEDLLKSLAKTLTLPGTTDDADNNTGGVAVVSFSLHGNVKDAAIWEFIETKLPSTQRSDSSGKVYKLKATCISQTETTEVSDTNQPCVVREGWNMEYTMIELDMVTEGMHSERWLAYVYEITWAPVGDVK